MYVRETIRVFEHVRLYSKVNSYNISIHVTEVNMAIFVELWQMDNIWERDLIQGRQLSKPPRLSLIHNIVAGVFIKSVCAGGPYGCSIIVKAIEALSSAS